jgi:anti-sigma factor RsiW
MFCDEVLDVIEIIAAGELTPRGRIADHLGTCPNCAAALASARRVEELLRARAVPRPSPQFTARTMARIRRAKWRSEQIFDMGFNLAIGLVLIGVIATFLLMMHRSGVVAVSHEALGLVRDELAVVVHGVMPSLPLYGAATALVLGALGIWWWVERDVAL